MAFIIIDYLQPSKGDKCYEYKYLATLSRRTHVAFIRTPPSSSPSSITLVTQLQPNRLQGLERLLMEWRGPASVALYASDEEAVDFAKYFRSNTKLRTLPDLVVHLVFKRQKQYPINYLRNVAMREVLTQYHLMLDVDFVPNSGLAQHAQNIFEKLSTTEETPVALVVPTFETSNSFYKIAENRSEFLHHLDEGKVLSYHQTAQWNLGHRYTSYAKWKTATDPYKVYGAFGYEPYLVIRAQDSPEYSELLLERMRDKFTYTVEVQVAGFQMFVLPDAYAVHMPHPKSTSHRLRKEDTSFEPCTSLIYQQVIRNISMNYPNSHTAEFIAKQFPPTKRPTTRKRRKKKRKKKPVASPASTTPHP
ncbi:hypothetical protein CAPTEDRAFT_177310 [Capitella teleta]|uniref:Glycosyltransferase-like protein LARGE2 n=1 Tax=Capitella teleta TaxID=283909 RepID=R7T975_CAPTE|nr:hypothetical protein CAPTEDRAFT_177310 [Capitella teleta]|eukprot:ELT90283.1 hypothetical protein CAPTEDRAFT_177310 [Capitella teleta]